jgi:hypothetical protein
MMNDLNTPRSTDTMLAEGMKAVEDWEAAEPFSRDEHVAAEQATRCFAELDAAMRDGGLTPTRWMLPYRCGICGRGFSSEEAADEHLDKDHRGQHGHG